MLSRNTVLFLSLLAIVSHTSAAVVSWDWKQDGSVFQECRSGGNPECIDVIWGNNTNWNASRVVGPHPSNLGADVVYQPGNWSSDVYPDNGSNGQNYDVIINSGPGPVLATGVAIDSLSLTGSTVLLRERGVISVEAGSVVNDGTIVVADQGPTTGTPIVHGAGLNFAADAMITGDGEIQFATANQNEIKGANDVTVGIGEDQTIRTVGSGNTGAITVDLTNQGVVDADNGVVAINTQLITNTGVLAASNNGYLLLGTQINGANVDNTDGEIVIDAQSGSNIKASVTGGEIVYGSANNIWTSAVLTDTIVSGAGSVNAKGATINNSSLDLATVSVGSSRLTLQNSVTNNSDIRLSDPSSSAGSFCSGCSLLTADGLVTLDGNGSITFTTSHQNEINGRNGGYLNLGAGQRITTTAGARGNINLQDSLTNNGVISADAGIITVRGGSNGITNNGVIEAINGGQIFTTGVIENSNGIVRTNGGVLSFLGTSPHAINGGVIDGGGNTLDMPGTFTLGGSTTELKDITLDVRHAEGVVLAGDITGNGVINLNDKIAGGGTFGSNTANLRIDGDITLRGDTAIRVKTAHENIIRRHSSGSTLSLDGARLDVDNGASVELKVDLANAGTIQNNGLIKVRGATLTNQQGGTIAGTGTLDAAGTTVLNAGQIAPGNSIGTTNIIGNVTFAGTSILSIEIGQSLGTPVNDVVNVSGLLKLGGLLDISFLDNLAFSSSDTFDIVSSGSLSGYFLNALPVVGGFGTGAFSGGTYDIFYDYAAGIVQVSNIQTVPSPASTLFLLLGILGLLIKRVR